MHAVLADPHAGRRLPRHPSPTAPHQAYMAYWLPPLYLMTYLLGWTRPDIGLMWWSDVRRPVECDLLGVLRHWDSRGQFDLLAAWIWRSPQALSVGQMLRHVCTAETQDDRRQVQPDPAWWQEFDARFPDPFGEDGRAFAPFDLFHGGSDPLHVGHHVKAALEGFRGHSIAALATHGSRPVIVLDSMPGWYGEMVRLCAAYELEKPVEVFCKPVGWLGTFRRSASSGLWHAAVEEVHTMGN